MLGHRLRRAIARIAADLRSLACCRIRLETASSRILHRRLPKNLTLLFLPSRTPELNPVGSVWQYLRQTWLSNRVFDTYEAIIEAAREAWYRLMDQPQAITSIGMHDWAHVGQ